MKIVLKKEAYYKPTCPGVTRRAKAACCLAGHCVGGSPAAVGAQLPGTCLGPGGQARRPTAGQRAETRGAALTGHYNYFCYYMYYYCCKEKY